MSPSSRKTSNRSECSPEAHMLFGGIDILAVHTVVNAAHGILVNLDEKRARPVLDEVYAKALDDVIEKLQLRAKVTQETADQTLPEFKSLVQRARRRPGNFLKHADRDPHQPPRCEKAKHFSLAARSVHSVHGIGAHANACHERLRAMASGGLPTRGRGQVENRHRLRARAGSCRTATNRTILATTKGIDVGRVPVRRLRRPSSL